MIKGIPVSEGYAIGKVFHWHDLQIDTTKKIVKNPEDEIHFFKDAITKTVTQLDILQKKALSDFGSDTAKIFEAHKLIAQDPDLITSVEKRITLESCNMLYALKIESDRYIEIFEGLDDPYLKERSLDLIDVTKRIFRNALDMSPNEMALPKKEIILVAHELTPSQIAFLDLKYIKGIITESGGKTSHSAIIAKLLGIPTIMGADHIFKLTKHGQEIIMDAFIGEIYINYDHATYESYLYRKNSYLTYKESLKRLLLTKPVSLDGINYHLSGQIGSSKDLDHVLQDGAEGIGLFRTEFLFINKEYAPSEDEQYVEYKKVLERVYPNPVVIRTIDLGGDKMTPYLKSTNDLNPSLGIRAIRLAIHQKDIIEEQLRALLRASNHGNLKIMFPMVTTLEDVLNVKSWINDVKKEFELNNMAYAPFEIGIMIETPSAALMADEFAKHVDFFSIGTNDLIQYTFAADRTNQDLDYLYRPFSPAIIKLIQMTSKAAHDHHIKVSVCGEMASDMLAVPLLLGLGIQELAMSSSLILKTKDFLLNHYHKDLVEAAEHVLSLPTEKEVLTYLKKVFPQN